MLNIDKNAKTVKGQKRGYLTGILYLAPADASGYEVCPGRSKGCTAACLYSAGRGAFSNVKASRINKTKRFFEEREAFMLELVASIYQLLAQAKSKNLIPCVRLNGTSDIAWEDVPITMPDGITYPNVMALFPDLQFYDYTKVINRNPPDNYHLTFSMHESNGNKAIAALENNLNLAVVFEELPDYYLGVPVVDGDENDLRFLDPTPCIVGLKAKGKARTDYSGFVVR